MAKTILPLPTIPTVGVPALDETAAADNATFQAAVTTKAGFRLHHKAIKLTFVPNQYCNLGCSYCYLGDLTENKDNPSDVVFTIQSHCEPSGSPGNPHQLVTFARCGNFDFASICIARPVQRIYGVSL